MGVVMVVVMVMIHVMVVMVMIHVMVVRVVMVVMVVVWVVMVVVVVARVVSMMIMVVVMGILVDRFTRGIIWKQMQIAKFLYQGKNISYLFRRIIESSVGGGCKIIIYQDLVGDKWESCA